MKIHALAAVVVAAGVSVPLLSGCGVTERDQDITVSEDGRTATMTRTQTRQTSEGAVVEETKTKQREIVQPAPNSIPDATERDAAEQ